MYIEKEFNKFGKAVVKQARTRLTKEKKNTSKDLYNSIGYKFKKNPNSFELSILMEDYGTFVDLGVKGRDSSAKAPRSPYKYKNKMPPVKVFTEWIKRKGITVRDAKGRFVKREGVAFAMAKKVQSEGLKTTNFLTRPFELAFQKLPDDIVEAYGLDVEDLLKFALK